MNSASHSSFLLLTHTLGTPLRVHTRTGSRFTFADTLPLAFLNWIRVINGPASAEWQRIAGSGKGFWSKQLEEADKNGWFKSV